MASAAQLRRFFGAHEQLYKGWLERLVGIGSYTRDPAGVARQACATVELFDEILRRPNASNAPPVVVRSSLVESAHPAYGPHVVIGVSSAGSGAAAAGSGAAAQSPRTFGLISHLDTVYPDTLLGEHKFGWDDRSATDDRVLGPGTMDIKGGTLVAAMIAHALSSPSLSPSPSGKADTGGDCTSPGPGPPGPLLAGTDTELVVLLNAAEEEMALDFGPLCVRELGDPAGNLGCLVFEAGVVTRSNQTGPADAYDAGQPTVAAASTVRLVTGRKGRCVWRLTADGIEGHAGNFHREGRNAIEELCRAVLEVSAVTDYGVGVTVNVGTITGGKGVNSIPGRADSLVEMRAGCPDSFAGAIQAIEAIIDGGGSAEADGHPFVSHARELTVPPWVENDGTRELAAVYRRAAEKAGCSVATEVRAGGSDANWLWSTYGCIDGCGPSGYNAHRSDPAAGDLEQEYAVWSSFATKATIGTLAVLERIHSPR